MGSSLLLTNSVISIDDMPIYTAVVTGVAVDTILGGAIANVVAHMRVYLAISIDNDTRGCSETS